MKAAFDESGREMRAFYRTLELTLSRYDTLEETPGGYALTYPATEAWRQRTARFERDFGTRFPAISISRSLLAGSQPRLELGGPPSARAFVERMLASAQAGGLRVPSPAKTQLVRGFRRVTSGLRRLPSFLILGAPRSGTTSLHAYLCEHPGVSSPVVKETGYFDLFHERGLGFYRSLFPLAARSAGTITGEATPTYLAHPLTPARVHAVLPHAKLIAMVRNPVERAFSQYHFGVRNGVESLAFEAAVEREPERLAGERALLESGGFSPEWVYHSYLTTGRYAEHLGRWTRVFPREQLLVVGMEAFAAEPAAQFARIMSFLELPAFTPTGFEALNAFPYPDLAPSTRERLAAYFRAPNERLWDFLGEDLGWNAR